LHERNLNDVFAFEVDFLYHSSTCYLKCIHFVIGLSLRFSIQVNSTPLKLEESFFDLLIGFKSVLSSLVFRVLTGDGGAILTSSD
jgi:hypothetical protein